MVKPLTEENAKAILSAIATIDGEPYTRPEGMSAMEAIDRLKEGDHESLTFKPDTAEITKLRTDVFVGIYNEDAAKRSQTCKAPAKTLLKLTEEASIGYELNSAEVIVEYVTGHATARHGDDVGKTLSQWSSEDRDTIRHDVAMEYLDAAEAELGEKTPEARSCAIGTAQEATGYRR